VPPLSLSLEMPMAGHWASPGGRGGGRGRGSEGLRRAVMGRHCESASQRVRGCGAASLSGFGAALGICSLLEGPLASHFF